MNPLLQTGALPAFSDIQPAHVTPAMDNLLADADAALERVVAAEAPADYDTLSLLLDVPVERLMGAWGHVSHLQGVADTPEWRAEHSRNLARIIDFSTRLGAHAGLYAKYKAVSESQGAALSPARQRVMSNALRDFVLGGAELQGEARERFARIQERAGALSQVFGQHVLDATDAFAYWADESQMAGVPQDVCEAARAAAQAEQREGYKLTLMAPCYLPVMTYAQDRDLRQLMYRAYVTRASDQGPSELDNTALIQELLELRLEEAQLLGFETYAHLSMVANMAGSPADVLTFVRDLARRARPFADKELAELSGFAREHLGMTALEAWDRAFVSEKLKQASYAFSSEEVRQYFTEPRVLQGLFQLIESLFNVSIRAEMAPVWHESVGFFRVWRGDQAVASFYLDLHARAGKQSGAWMDACRSRWRRPEGELQLPVAHLVCNFAPPVGGRPSLLSHDHVITLFHEFGHGLHHMLTQVEDLAVAGISGVESDAVELPSQFMENFCWEWSVLQGMTAHVETGEALPRELFERMLAARHFQSALGLLRQCEYALFDMRVHHEPQASAHAQRVADEVCAEVQPVPAPPFARYAASFTHLFDGGYAAGYYGYAWAQVLSADAFAAFEEVGVMDPQVGRRFREEILEVGGSRPAIESFRAFRGREPQLDALLRHQGLS
jgi:oligopeptidase A